MRRVDGREQVVRARGLVGEREVDRRLDLRLHSAQARRAASSSPSAQSPLEPRQRILRLPFLDHGRIPDVGQVRAHGVLHAAERLQLEEGRAAAVPGALERRCDGVLDRDHVVAVDDLPRHAVPGRALDEVGDGALGVPAGRQRELVVLAGEHDRQLPGGGEVHRLVRGPLAGRAVAEERDRRLVRPAKLRGQRRPARVREAGSDDPVAADDVEGEVGDVHRAAEPLAVAGPPAEHLGHHPAHVGTRGDQVAVRAVVADEVVAGAHDARRRRRDRLLPDAAVRGADDHAFPEELRGAILEHADPHHHAVLLDERLPRPPRLGGRVTRHRRTLVELDDVPVGVERVEALPAAVGAAPISTGRGERKLTPRAERSA